MISEQSNLVSKTIGLLFPLMLIIGFYVIINGHISPGGGFQGGGIIASLFIVKYLMEPIEDFELKKIQFIEKLVLLLILCFAIAFMLMQLYAHGVLVTKLYLVLMNLLIGLKVACGMTIIFYRFAFYESR